jgi:phage repressor protein C with HTH and peptisase S24 domain
MDMHPKVIKYPWGKRLDAKLAEKNWTSPQLADQMFARGYTHDSVTGKPRDRTKLIKSIDKYRSGDVGQPRGSLMQDIAATIGVSRHWLAEGIETASPDREHLSRNLIEVHGNTALRNAPQQFGTIQVRGIMAEGLGPSGGGLEIKPAGEDVVGVVDAPASVANVRGAYAMYVMDNTMQEALRQGYVAYVNPHVPIRKDDEVVIQVTFDGGDCVYAFVRRFVSMDDKQVKVRQLNPPKQIAYARKDVVAIHRIVGASFRD